MLIIYFTGVLRITIKLRGYYLSYGGITWGIKGALG
jgi:hypothetical protein